MDSTLYVKTLGGFSLKHICTEDQNLEITEQDSNSWRQWAFLEYLGASDLISYSQGRKNVVKCREETAGWRKHETADIE